MPITNSLPSEIQGVPDEFQVFPYGALVLDDNTQAFVDSSGIQAMIQTFIQRGNDMVIDYEHQTLKDVQAPAAGWIKTLVDRGNQGLWAKVEWTDRAREYLKNREYRYFSPVFFITPTNNRVVKLVNVALTNSPKINDIRPIVSKHCYIDNNDGLYSGHDAEKIDWLKR